jgi:hypothetical protein
MNDLQSFVEDAYETAKAGSWGELLEEWANSPVLLSRCSRFIKSGSSWTFLHQAAYFGHDRACRVLLGRGANVGARSKDLRTPADVATQRGHVAVGELLRAAAIDELWEPSLDPDVLPSSNRWGEATQAMSNTDVYVAYGGATIKIPKGTTHFVDSLSRILVGWHGTFDPPRGMDAESLLG